MKYQDLDKWDKRFIDMAQMVAGWSKGPRSRVGCVLVRPDRTIASTGYNGPPRGFDDELFVGMSREEQHKVVKHAEANAVHFLVGHDRYLRELTAYIYGLPPCDECALELSLVCERVLASYGSVNEPWLSKLEKSKLAFKLHNVIYETLEF